MITRDHMIIALITVSLLMLFPYQASAEAVRCDQCTKEYPCAIQFEFRDVKFVHNLYCEDVDDMEVWGSEDEEKYDVFYFERSGGSKSKSQLDI